MDAPAPHEDEAYPVDLIMGLPYFPKPYTVQQLANIYRLLLLWNRTAPPQPRGNEDHVLFEGWDWRETAPRKLRPLLLKICNLSDALLADHRCWRNPVLLKPV